MHEKHDTNVTLHRSLTPTRQKNKRESFHFFRRKNRNITDQPEVHRLNEIRDTKSVVTEGGRQTGSSHLYHVQLADDVLSVVARMVQVSLQCLHLPPDHLQILLYLGPLRVGHLIQQSRGAGLVLVVQDAGEDPHVDVQSDVHQLELFSSLWRSGGV